MKFWKVIFCTLIRGHYLNDYCNSTIVIFVDVVMVKSKHVKLCFCVNRFFVRKWEFKKLKICVSKLEVKPGVSVEQSDFENKVSKKLR